MVEGTIFEKMVSTLTTHTTAGKYRLYIIVIAKSEWSKIIDGNCVCDCPQWISAVFTFQSVN